MRLTFFTLLLGIGLSVAATGQGVACSLYESSRDQTASYQTAQNQTSQSSSASQSSTDQAH
jgi:hypothetical protein